MRIALTSFYLPSCDKIGVGYQAHYMGQALVDRGHSVTMFSPAPRVADASYEHNQVDAGRHFRLHGFAWALRSIDFSGFDVLHSHGETQWVGWFARRRRPRLHVRTIHGSCVEEAIHIRGISSRVRMLYIAAMELVSYLVADKTVAVSENSKRFAPWIPSVIPNGVEMNAFYPGPKLIKPTILFVGTYSHRKRGKLLIEIFRSKIRDAVPDAQLHMVCSDVPPSELTAGVSMLGKLSRNELAQKFRESWVFCLPSTYEGFGVPYIEAMASGTPVVATPNPGSKEVTELGRYGVIASDETLAEELIRVLTNKQLAENLIHLGLKRSEQYSWTTVLDQYEQLYAR